MHNRAIAITVSIILITLTSGCLGGGGDSNDFGSEEISVESLTEESPIEDLENFSSYTINTSVTISNASDTYTLFSIYKEVNRTSNRGYLDSSIFFNQSKYTSDGVTYVKTESNLLNGTQYDKSTKPYDDPNTSVLDDTFTTGDLPTNFQNTTLEKQEYRTYDGSDVAVYIDESTGNFSQNFSSENVTYDERTITYYRTEDGFIPLLRIKYTGLNSETNESVSQTVSLKLRDINETVVRDAPKWISEAEGGTR